MGFGRIPIIDLHWTQDEKLILIFQNFEIKIYQNPNFSKLINSYQLDDKKILHTDYQYV